MSDQQFDKLIVTDRIGIGTDKPEPETQLHISATSKDGKIYLESGGNLLQVAVTSTIASIGTTGNSPLQLQTNLSQSASSGIYLSQNGNVGVGTTNPKFALDVQGTINASQFYKDGTPWKVNGNEIESNTITAANIQNKTITQDKLDPSIPLGIADGAVTTPKIANGAVTAAKIADNSITTAKIQNEAITQEKLAASISLPIPDGSVGTAKLANSAITTDKIADKSITAAKLNFSIPLGSSQWKGKDGEPISYSGNVGIGTTSTPQAKLQIANGAIMPSVGNTETSGIMFPKDAFGGGGDAAWIRYYAQTGEATTLEIGTSNDADDHIALLPSGNVGIGTTTPSAKLHIFEPADATDEGGSIKFFDKGSEYKYEISYDGGTDGQFTFTNTGIAEGETRFQSEATGLKLLTIKNNGDVIGKLVNPSSRELKENITDFSTQEAIEALANLNPVKFNYREDNQKQLKAGFIAEDVPELVATADRKGICALDIVAILTKVIQQQQEELSCLKERLNALEASV